VTKPIVDDPVPPRWMNRILCALVRQGDDGAIEGDLLEEYNEEVLPRAGRFRANVWYFRQVLSFVRFSPRAVLGGVAWIACGAYLLFVAMDTVLIGNYGRGFLGTLILVGELAVVLNAMGALRSIRLAALGRNALVFGVVIGLLLGTRFVLDVFARPNPFSTIGRDIEIGEVLLGILLAAGIWGGWRLAQFRAGVLVALAAGAIGWIVSLVVIAGVALYVPGQFTEIFIRHEDVWSLGRDVVGAAAVLGTTGAMFARGLQGFALDRRQIARP
jgi:hypothetical protein